MGNKQNNSVAMWGEVEEILRTQGCLPKGMEQKEKEPEHSLKSRFHKNGHMLLNEFHMAKLIIQLGLLYFDIVTFNEDEEKEEEFKLEDLMSEVDLLPMLLSRLNENKVDITSTVELKKAVKKFTEMKKVEYHKLLQVTCLTCVRKYVKDVFEGTSAKADIDLLKSLTNIDDIELKSTALPDKSSSVDSMVLTPTPKFKMELNMSGTYQPILEECWGCKEGVLGFGFRWPFSLFAEKIFKCDQKIIHVPGESFISQSRVPLCDVSLSGVSSKKYLISPPFVFETISVETVEPYLPIEPFGIIKVIVCLLSMKEVDELVKQGLIPRPGLRHLMQKKMIIGTLENTKMCFRWHADKLGRMHFQAQYVRPNGELCGQRRMYVLMKKV